MPDDFERPRFSLVPWLLDLVDLRPMGPPESSVEEGRTDLTLGLYIPYPFGKNTDAMLQIHATTGNGNDGGTITLAISNVIVRPEPAPAKKTTKKFYPGPDGHSLEGEGD